MSEATPPPAARRRLAPSLMRRVLLTVTLAILAVYAVVLALLLSEALSSDSGDLDRMLLQSARSLARTLAHVDAEADPRVARALFAEVEAQRREARTDDDPDVHVKVVRRSDGLLMNSSGAPALETGGLEPGLHHRLLAGRTLRLYHAQSGSWGVTLVDDVALRRAAVLRSLLRDLALYLSFTLPIILLPVWLAVRAVLGPLRRLSEGVSARAPGDMRPIVLDRTYRELQPLQAALNRLFERVQAGFEREKGFVHDAAHELRTPLAVIGTQAHVLQASEGAARDEAAQRLQDAVARASHLAHQLLRLAQADATALAPRETVDVMNVARDTLAGLAELAAAHGGELSLTGPDSAVLDTDPRALRSMLGNLVDNALRYGGPGVAVDVSIEVLAASWSLQVADNGPGIPGEHRERVFERFWRGQARDQRGAGLGLAIVRGAARSLGGDVTLQPGPDGRGCLFCVDLPRM